LKIAAPNSAIAMLCVLWTFEIAFGEDIYEKKNGHSLF